MKKILLFSVPPLCVLVALLWAFSRPAGFGHGDLPLKAEPQIIDESGWVDRVTDVLRRSELIPDVPATADPNPYLLAKTANEAIEHLRGVEPWGDASVRYFQSQWLTVCVREGRVARMADHVRVHLGFDEVIFDELVYFCHGALPSSLDLYDSTDNQAIREVAEDLMIDSSLGLVTDGLEGMHSQEGLDATLAEVARILSSSVDEGAVLAALDFLRRHGDLKPPYPDVPMSGELMYASQIVNMDVAALLVCRHIGGCQYPHPMVLRRCLQSQYGCYRPYDYWSVVEQTTAPIEFAAVISLHNQALALVRRYAGR